MSILLVFQKNPIGRKPMPLVLTIFGVLLRGQRAVTFSAAPSVLPDRAQWAQKM